MRRSIHLAPAGLLLACFFLFSIRGFSQTLTYENPPLFSACGEGVFSFTVQNNSGAVLSGVGLAITFGTSTGSACGVGYQPGSVSGAAEGNISNPAAPVFQLSNLAAGASQTVTLTATSNCTTAACADNAEVFTNQATLTWSGGSTAITSNPYVVERALLVITSVNSTVMQGARGDVLLRQVTVRNTRPGALERFVFTDTYQPGISVATAQGNDISPGGNVWQAELDGSDFAAIGDGDGLFEMDETIVITEEITVTECGVDIASAVSDIEVGWGCGGETCQSETANGIVIFVPYQRVPNLAFEPIITVPACFCGPEGHQQGMKITNAGDGKALNIELSVRPDGFWSYGWIDTASVKVDSEGVLINFTDTFPQLDQLPDPACIGPANVAEAMIVRLAELAPGASVTVFWDAYFCQTGCNRSQLSWYYRYSYFKECPPNIFIQSGNWIRTEATGNQPLAYADINIPGPLQDGTDYTVFYELDYDSLLLSGQQLLLEFQVPCGMVWDDNNDLALNGQLPASVDLVQMDSFLTVSALYDLPLDNDTASLSFDFAFQCDEICFSELLCTDSVATTCAIPYCEPPPATLIGGLITATVLKCEGAPACNLQACANFGSTYDCPLDSTCVLSPPAYVEYEFEAARKNYGLPDNDNNQYADGTGLPDLSLVQRHRLVTGDTIQAVLRGIVIADQPNAVLEKGDISLHFSPVSNLPSIGMSNVDFLFSSSGIRSAGNELRIYDSSAGTWYTCNNLPAIDQGALAYHFDLSAAALGGCVPPGFVFAGGDSLVFVGNFRIHYNIKPDNDPDPLLCGVIVSPEIRVYEADNSAYEPLVCGCHSQQFELSGYEARLTPGNFALPPCGPSQFVAGSQLIFQLHAGNFFPYEHRNLMTLLDWELAIPSNIALNQTRLTSLRFQGGANVVSNQFLTPDFTNGVYHFDLANFQNSPLDEGFSALIQYIFENDCHNVAPMPASFTAHLDFVPGLQVPVNPLEIQVTATSLRPLIANLAVTSALSDLISYSNQLVYDFTLTNTPTSVASQSSGPAPNAWLYVVSQTGQVVDFQLFNQATNQPVPSVNGVFQLGSLPIDSLGTAFRLTATNLSCETEQLAIYYGWNCTPFTSPVQDRCYEKIKTISITSPPGEIDLIVGSPVGCFDLCDTLPGHSVELFNAQLGSVYDLRLTALLPPGLSVLGGSCEVEYPTGSGVSYPIADPQQLGGGTVEWNLSNLLAPIADGLPGVSASDSNSLTVNFLCKTECGFLAEGFVLFVAAAKQNCGLPTNTVAKPADPLCINGVSSSFSTTINAEATPGFGCNDEVHFQLTLNATATLPPGTCLIATLPPGVAYLPGSCSSACQANFNCNPTVDSGLVTWQLPTGVPANQLVCFEFSTAGWSGLGCENGVVLFRSAAETMAVCAETGDSCSTKVSTGSFIFPYTPQRPAFDLGDFEITATSLGSTDLVNFNITVTNNGATNEPPVVVQFFTDTNGDGTGDQLVHTESTLASLANGQSVVLSGSFEVPSGHLCNLIASLDPALQCACDGDLAQVTAPIEYQTNQAWTVCAGQDLPIGVAATAGATYQWLPADCLLDELAASTVFNCGNESGLPSVYDLVLSESRVFCEIEHQFQVTVQPAPGIFFFESPICAGEMANLAATAGTSFTWQGPGVVQGQQIQTVSPAATASYAVTVVDAFGCSGSDTATVVVAPLPLLDAGADTVFCPGVAPQLGATFDPDFGYLWSPSTVGGQAALNDPTVANPFVLTSAPTVFTLTVTDENGCSATDAVSIAFGETPQPNLMASPDTICAGAMATIGGSNPDYLYSWSPSDGECLPPLPECSIYQVSPAATTTYVATVTSAASGCTATASVTIFVATDVIYQTLPPVEVCEGESSIVLGELVSQPGLYCDTVQVLGSCDSIICQELRLLSVSDTTLLDTSVCEGQSLDFQGTIVTQSGTYCVYFTDGNGCDSLVCLQATVLDTPSLEILLAGLSDTLTLGDTAFLSIPPGDYASITWLANGTELTGCANSTTCLQVPTERTEYQVTATLGSGCSGSAAKAVAISAGCDPEKVEVPNAFSPNGDQTNDVFDIVGPGAEAIVSLKIWNRWGEKVHDSPSPWDGTVDGKPAPSDVYVYLLKIGCAVAVDAEEKLLKGDVTLLR